MGGSYRWGRRSDNHVDLEPNELCGKSGKPSGFAVRVSSFDDSVLPLHVADIAETLAEGLDVSGISRGRACRQIAYPSDTRSLRPRDKRRRGERSNTTDKKGPPVHY